MKDSAQYNYPIRSTTVSTVLRVILLIILTIIMSLFLFIPYLLLKDIIDSVDSLIFSLFIVEIIILIFSSMGIVSILFHWVKKSYVIKPNEIIIQTGIFNIKQKIYPLNGDEEIKIYRTLLGKFFNFGTVSIYQPVLQKYINLENIQDPDLYTEVIRQNKTKEFIQGKKIIVKKPK